MKALWVVAVPAAMFASLLGFLTIVGGPPAAQAHSFCIPDSHGSSQPVAISEEQLANAATIIDVGRSRNVPPRGWVIALAASLQESSLRNLSYGDRDSAGLFQMRPSMDWGTYEQVTDPVYSATAFYGGPDVPPDNAGLLDLDGWQDLSITEAAQAVERSAYPDAYTEWVDDAAAIVQRLEGESFECPSPMAASCPDTGRSAEAGLTPDAQLVLRCAVAHFDIASIGGLAQSGHVEGSDHYTGRAVDLMIDNWTTSAGAAFGDRVAAYFVSNADEFGISYIIWRGRIWTTSRPYWRPYGHPGSRTDPTALHMDHLHISVTGSATTNLKETVSWAPSRTST